MLNIKYVIILKRLGENWKTPRNVEEVASKFTMNSNARTDNSMLERYMALEQPSDRIQVATPCFPVFVTLSNLAEITSLAVYKLV